jgi:hypothetical protein
MRKPLGICLLVLLLTGSAVAGEMPNLSPAPPPSQPATAVQEPTDGATPNGEIHTPPVSESLTQTMLELLAALSSLL